MIKLSERYDFNKETKPLSVDTTLLDFNKEEVEKALYFGYGIKINNDKQPSSRLLKLFCTVIGARPTTDNPDVYTLWEPEIKISISHVKLHGKDKKYFGDNKDKLYVYMGRPSDFGNPYYAPTEETRDIVCDLHGISIDNPISRGYINELVNEILENNVKELHLGCYCYPKRCHTEDIRLAIYKELYKRYYRYNSKKFIQDNVVYLDDITGGMYEGVYYQHRNIPIIYSVDKSSKCVEIEGYNPDGELQLFKFKNINKLYTFIANEYDGTILKFFKTFINTYTEKDKIIVFRSPYVDVTILDLFRYYLTVHKLIDKETINRMRVETMIDVLADISVDDNIRVGYRVNEPSKPLNMDNLDRNKRIYISDNPTDWFPYHLKDGDTYRLYKVTYRVSNVKTFTDLDKYHDYNKINKVHDTVSFYGDELQEHLIKTSNIISIEPDTPIPVVNRVPNNNKIRTLLDETNKIIESIHTEKVIDDTDQLNKLTKLMNESTTDKIDTDKVIRCLSLLQIQTKEDISHLLSDDELENTSEDIFAILENLDTVGENGSDLDEFVLINNKVTELDNIIYYKHPSVDLLFNVNKDTKHIELSDINYLEYIKSDSIENLLNIIVDRYGYDIFRFFKDFNRLTIKGTDNKIFNTGVEVTLKDLEILFEETWKDELTKNDK